MVGDSAKPCPECKKLRALLREAEQWVAKLAADAPEGMVGKGVIIRRSLDKIHEALNGRR